MAKDLYNPPSAWTSSWPAPLPANWTPVFWPSSTPPSNTTVDNARVSAQAVQDTPPTGGVVQTASVSTQRANNAPSSVKVNTSALDGVNSSKSLYDMSGKDLKDNMGTLGVNIAKMTSRNVLEEVEAKMGGTTSFDRDIMRLQYEKNRIRPTMMWGTNEYADPYTREKLIAQEEARIEQKIVDVQAQKQSRLGTIDKALNVALEDKKNDLAAAAKLYEVYKDEIGDRREAEKLKVQMEQMQLDIQKTTQEIEFNRKAMPIKLANLESENNQLSRNPNTGEMEVYDKNGTRVDAELSSTTKNLLAQQDGYLPTDGRIREGGRGYECGEGANRLTGMSSTPGGNSKTARAAAFSDKSPVLFGQVFFNGPGFDQTYGHIGTVVNYDATNRTITTKDFNKKWDGTMTTQTYSLDALAKQGVSVGFYNKTPAAQKIEKASGSSGLDMSNTNVATMRDMLRGTSYTSADKDAIIKLAAQGKGINDIIAMWYSDLGTVAAERQVQSTAFEEADFSENQAKNGYPNIIKAFQDYSQSYKDYLTPAEIADNLMYAAEGQGKKAEVTKAFLTKGMYVYEDASGDLILGNLSNDSQIEPIIQALYDDGFGKEEIMPLLEESNTDVKWGWFSWDTPLYEKAQKIIDKLK